MHYIICFLAQLEENGPGVTDYVNNGCNTFLTAVFKQADLNSTILSRLQIQSEQQLLNFTGSVWTEYIKGISRLISNVLLLERQHLL